MPKDVCCAIVKLLLAQYIKFPTSSALRAVVDGSEHNLGFPQCARAVDGCRIPIMSHHKNVQPTFVTAKGGTQLTCKERSIINRLLDKMFQLPCLVIRLIHFYRG